MRAFVCCKRLRRFLVAPLDVLEQIIHFKSHLLIKASENILASAFCFIDKSIIREYNQEHRNSVFIIIPSFAIELTPVKTNKCYCLLKIKTD